MDHPTLTDLANDLRALTDRWQAMRRAHDDQALTQRPSAEAWSVAEVCEHLRVTGGLYYPIMTDHAEKLRASGRAGGGDPVRPGFFAKRFIHFAGPNNKRKIPAPERFKPAEGATDIEAIDQLIAQQSQLQQLIHSAEGLALNAGKFPTPITKLIRLTLGEGLMLMVRHQQRHAEQAERALS